MGLDARCLHIPTGTESHGRDWINGVLASTFGSGPSDLCSGCSDSLWVEVGSNEIKQRGCTVCSTPARCDSYKACAWLLVWSGSSRTNSGSSAGENQGAVRVLAFLTESLGLA